MFCSLLVLVPLCALPSLSTAKWQICQAHRDPNSPAPRSVRYPRFSFESSRIFLFSRARPRLKSACVNVQTRVSSSATIANHGASQAVQTCGLTVEDVFALAASDVVPDDLHHRNPGCLGYYLALGCLVRFYVEANHV